MKKVELLADALLDSTWTEKEMESIIVAVTREGSMARTTLSQRLSVRFPAPPSRSALIEYLSQQAKGKMVRKARFRRLRRLLQSNRFRVVGMRHAIPVASNWDIPPLGTLDELASFFELPPKLIDWLACDRHTHYRTLAVRKKRSGLRLLEAPKQRLKQVQHRIAESILNSIPTHPCAHGFVRGRSAVTYVSPHVGKSVVLRMDLMDFFPSIRGSRVFGLFRSLGYPYAITTLLTRLCIARAPMEIFDESNHRTLGEQSLPRLELDRLRSLYCQSHLPQGSPASPALANLICYRLDCRLAGLAAASGVQYTRYADDLLFSAEHSFARTAKSFAVQVASIALDEGFDVHFRKTRIMSRSTRQFAAGIVLNRKTNLRRDEFDELKATLFNCMSNGPESQNRMMHSNFRMHLLGRINWVKQLNPARGEKLMKIFDRINWPN